MASWRLPSFQTLRAAENYSSHTDERNERDLDYVNNYVVVEERSKKWVAFVDHQDKEFGDYHVKFLQPVLSAGTRIWYYFQKRG